MGSPILRHGLPLVALVLLLGGCARPTGDFGRAGDSVLHDEIMPAIGHAQASARGEPVSDFNLADEEIEMRDRVWRFLVAPHAYDWFGDVAAEFERTRIAPMGTTSRKVGDYYGWLHQTRFASSRVRFGRITDDAVADTVLMPSVFRSICAVVEIDRRRTIAARDLDTLDPASRASATARKFENGAVIDWFVGSARHRFQSYSYALDHLLVETPHEDAIAANASLNELVVWVEAAERGDFCFTEPNGKGPVSVPLRSRIATLAPSEGEYRK